MQRQMKDDSARLCLEPLVKVCKVDGFFPRYDTA
jgi:hypothetical protein